MIRGGLADKAGSRLVGENQWVRVRSLAVAPIFDERHHLDAARRGVDDDLVGCRDGDCH